MSGKGTYYFQDPHFRTIDLSVKKMSNCFIGDDITCCMLNCKKGGGGYPSKNPGKPSGGGRDND